MKRYRCDGKHGEDPNLGQARSGHQAECQSRATKVDRQHCVSYNLNLLESDKGIPPSPSFSPLPSFHRPHVPHGGRANSDGPAFFIPSTLQGLPGVEWCEDRVKLEFRFMQRARTGWSDPLALMVTAGVHMLDVQVERCCRRFIA